MKLTLGHLPFFAVEFMPADPDDSATEPQINLWAQEGDLSEEHMRAFLPALDQLVASWHERLDPSTTADNSPDTDSTEAADAVYMETFKHGYVDSKAEYADERSFSGSFSTVTSLYYKARCPDHAEDWETEWSQDQPWVLGTLRRHNAEDHIEREKGTPRHPGGGAVSGGLIARMDKDGMLHAIKSGAGTLDGLSGRISSGGAINISGHEINTPISKPLDDADIYRQSMKMRGMLS